MKSENPIREVEELVRRADSDAERYFRSGFRRYPMLFSVLVVMSSAAILHGFELIFEDQSVFREHPSLLIALGTLGLFLTGRLHRWLGQMA